MKKRLFVLTILGFMAFLSPQSAQADVWEAAESDQYGRKAGGMLGRGLINVGSCFVDLIVHTVDKTKDGPPLIGTLTGIGSGAGCTILRAGSGVVDVASFWVPGFNGLPVSKNYHNCLESDGNYSSSNQYSQNSYVASNSYAAPSSSPASYSAPESSAKAPVWDKGGHDDGNAMKYVKK